MKRQILRELVYKHHITSFETINFLSKALDKYAESEVERRIKSISPKVLAELFHDIYETFAPIHGYETREDTREFDSNSKNGKLMIATCKHLIETGLVDIIPTIKKDYEK